MGDPPRHISTYSYENVASADDGRLFSPSFARNFNPIRDALSATLPRPPGQVLEIGSGTGQHIAHFALEFPDWHWQPSDHQKAHFPSISAWRRFTGAGNLSDPVLLDAVGTWEMAAGLTPTCVFSANVIHIAPWLVALGICRGAGALMAPGGKLIFYGPFKEGGRHTGEGNARFDTALRESDPAWGVRNLGDLAKAAAEAGFGPPSVHVMPSNNRFVVFTRA